MIRSQVLICGGTGCTSSGSQQIQDRFVTEIEKNDLQDEIKLVRTGCFGLCEAGPVVIVYPDGTFYSQVEEKDVKDIVEEHLLKGRPVERLVYKDTGDVTEEEIGNVEIDDTVYVHVKSLDVDVTAKVIKTVYEPMKDRYKSVEVGNFRTSITDAIRSVRG